MPTLKAIAVAAIAALAWAASSAANAEVRELYRPPSGTADGVIVFVHGLGGDPVETFSADTSKEASWPMMMATDTEPFGPDAKPLSSYAIATVHYPAGPNDTLSIVQAANNLRSDIADTLSAYRSIYFIAHSLGGLIVKLVLTEDHLQRGGLLERTRAVFLIASPINGAGIAGVSDLLTKAFAGRIALDLKPLEENALLDQIQAQWKAVKKQATTQQVFKVFCAYETKGYSYRAMLPAITVVRYQDIDRDCDAERAENGADHISIVKPSRRDADSIYRWVKARLAQVGSAEIRQKPIPSGAVSAPKSGIPATESDSQPIGRQTPSPRSPEPTETSAPTARGARSESAATTTPNYLNQQNAEQASTHPLLNLKRAISGLPDASRLYSARLLLDKPLLIKPDGDEVLVAWPIQISIDQGMFAEVSRQIRVSLTSLAASTSEGFEIATSLAGRYRAEDNLRIAGLLSSQDVRSVRDSPLVSSVKRVGQPGIYHTDDALQRTLASTYSRLNVDAKHVAVLIAKSGGVGGTMRFTGYSVPLEALPILMCASLGQLDLRVRGFGSDGNVLWEDTAPAAETEARGKLTNDLVRVVLGGSLPMNEEQLVREFEVAMRPVQPEYQLPTRVCLHPDAQLERDVSGLRQVWMRSPIVDPASGFSRPDKPLVVMIAPWLFVQMGPANPLGINSSYTVIYARKIARADLEALSKIEATIAP